MYDATRTPAAPSPTSKPFWSRPKVGAAGLVLGLAIGLAPTGDAEPSDQAATPSQTPVPSATVTEVVQQGATDEEVKELVEAATGELEDQLATQQAELTAQQEQAAADLGDLRLRARRAQSAAVDKAVARALADVSVPVAETPDPVEEQPEPEPVTATDPMFGTCGDAKDAGYGPYYAGSDPEYDWYDDRDDDGVVCE